MMNTLNQQSEQPSEQFLKDAVTVFERALALKDDEFDVENVVYNLCRVYYTLQQWNDVVRIETVRLEYDLEETAKAYSLLRRAQAHMKLENNIEALRDLENIKHGVLTQYQASIDKKVCM